MKLPRAKYSPASAVWFSARRRASPREESVTGRVSTVLANEVYRLGGELTRREKNVGTALNVLLGGLPLSALMFGVCFAFLK